jgi:hypothetical protein
MRRRWAWLAAGSGIVAATTSTACGPTETTCEESATCPPGAGGSAGAAGVGGSAGASMMDSGHGAAGAGGGHEDGGVPRDVSGKDSDASIDRRPPDDVSIDTRDADLRIDAIGPDDVSGDAIEPDVPGIVDVRTEADACDPGTSKSPVDNACLISETYGVFVSPQGSDTTGVGTRSAPYKTLLKALQAAKGNVMRVYACDEGTGYTDALSIDATLDGMSLYGGFECGTWAYAGTRRARVHPASGVALSVKSLTTGLTLEDFEFVAADAPVGASSIGGVVDTALNVVLRRVRIAAGKGGGGENGADGAKGGDGPSTGQAQQGSPAMCPPATSPQNGGAWSAGSACGSLGGNGGQAAQNNDGAPGFPGNPRTGVTPPDVNNRGTEGPTGQDGKAGSVGNAGGSGTASAANGTFTSVGYTVAAAGGNGTVGNVGQGGGGGGASNAPASSTCIGASGGAGGMGGCGGSPGMGGASAGASVALLVWMSPLTLDGCNLTAGAGGAGGNGGKGGVGGKGKDGALGGAGFVGEAGAPADGGVGLGPGGQGGPGGNGGNGGSGAGGNGGPSYGVVYKGTVPTKVGGTVIAHGAGGGKGMGGSVGSAKAPDGTVGPAADEFAVP